LVLKALIDFKMWKFSKVLYKVPYKFTLNNRYELLFRVNILAGAAVYFLCFLNSFKLPF